MIIVTFIRTVIIFTIVINVVNTITIAFYFAF